MTGAPLIILYGTEDSYREGSSVPEFKQPLQAKSKFEEMTVEYTGAAHDFNHNALPEDHWDPVAVGDKARTAWSAGAANDSVPCVADFLRKGLTAK